MNRPVCITVILFIIAGTLNSCSFRRLASGKNPKSFDWHKTTDTSHTAGNVPRFIYPQPDTAGVVPDSLILTKKLISELTPLWNTRYAYTTFSGKAKVHYESPDDQQEFTAHFRIRKDSIIWIAITGLGGMVQVARIYITPDSFILVNQMQKEVTRIPLSRAAKVLPAKVDFTSLERLIVGESLRDGVITNAKSFDNSWALQVEDSSYIQHITYNKADSTIRTAQLHTRDPKGPVAEVTYEDYQTMNKQKVSTNRVLNIQNGNDIYKIEMNFQRTDFDIPLDYPVSIPESYTPKDIKN